MNTIILDMLKIDLGINHNVRDDFFNKLIESSKAQLKRTGIELDDISTEDVMLLSDYCAWVYRKRNDNVGLSENLKMRLRDRRVKGRADHA